MNKELADIIDILKQMPLIEGQWKEFSKEETTEKFAFYKLADNRNYLFYYFDYSVREQINEDKSYTKVSELVVKEAEKFLGEYYSEYIPQDTYVVFFSKVSEHVDELQKFIIRVEENEFLFKKYVCLYTEDELSELQSILPKVETNRVFWSNENLISEKKNLTSQLLLRLTIKVPIVTLNFAEIKFNSVQNRVSAMIYDKDNLKKLNNDLVSWIETENPEVVGELLFKELVGEVDEI
ncbi:hypothetical protein G8B50_02905 [Enterococcus durans]|uniref:ABC-three component system middle component 1 n=1 Tax=Enterococcus durans TaxID=53345 RepID=UPI001883A18A|nr:ABC-three component system middle component 1 [Enterococcus durans]MBE9886656.1 hypothetical protein [Enterococcus durans]